MRQSISRCQTPRAAYRFSILLIDDMHCAYYRLPISTVSEFENMPPLMHKVAAALAAVLITLPAMVMVVAVPPASGAEVAIAATPLLA
jgi:hypothetical protein